MAVRINRALVALLCLGILSFLFYVLGEGHSLYNPASHFDIDGTSGRAGRFGTGFSLDDKTTPKDPTQDATAVAPKNTLATDPVLALLNDPLPRRDFGNYSEQPPHNIKDTSGKAFATFFCTRNPDPRDPFFAATQSIIWRILWSQWHSVHPIIVYVCPFTPETQRSILRGQGAIVKETELLDIVPTDKVPVARWRDQFSKLNMWKETDLKKIVYLDVDAFPIANIDDVFDQVPEQTCIKSLLSADDKVVMQKSIKGGQDLCRYSFGGIDPYGAGEVNGGFLVFSPNLRMYEKLINDAKKTDQYDISKMEQGLLHSSLAFGHDGPFPSTFLPPVYNAVGDYYKTRRGEKDPTQSPDGPIRVVHEKIWNGMVTESVPELNQRWDLDWMTMCRFYDSDVFTYARETGRLKDNLEIYLDALQVKERA